MPADKNPIERHHPNMPPATAFHLWPWVERGFDIEVGNYTYGTPSLHWSEGEKTTHRLRIGPFCSIAAEVAIYVGSQGMHSLDFVSTYPMAMVFGHAAGAERPAAHQARLDVTIGADVWIGRGAIIQSGVSIGHGAVIGTRALVTRDVDPYAVVAGIPARPIRKRFSDEHIARLLALEWWTWPDTRIRETRLAFMTGDMDRALDMLESAAKT